MRLIYFVVYILSNFAFQAFYPGAGDYMVAFDRSYFQGMVFLLWYFYDKRKEILNNII